MTYLPWSHCRCCGYWVDDGDFMPWGSDGKLPSFDICDCCGVEFGYEDSTEIGIRRYRRLWTEAGYSWSKPGVKPEGWIAEVQLAMVPPEFR